MIQEAVLLHHRQYMIVLSPQQRIKLVSLLEVQEAQTKPFFAAQSKIEAESPRIVVFETMNTEDVRRRGWSPKELIGYLDIYFHFLE